jgi:hypothetical protein
MRLGFTLRPSMRSRYESCPALTTHFTHVNGRVVSAFSGLVTLLSLHTGEGNAFPVPRL